MKGVSNINNCRICGYFMEDPPWGEDGLSPTYEICPCCGVEFGNEDYTLDSTIKYRRQWFNSKINWFEKKYKPENWDLEKQMQNIPKEYKLEIEENKDL